MTKHTNSTKITSGKADHTHHRCAEKNKVDRQAARAKVCLVSDANPNKDQPNRLWQTIVHRVRTRGGAHEPKEDSAESNNRTQKRNGKVHHVLPPGTSNTTRMAKRNHISRLLRSQESLLACFNASAAKYTNILHQQFGKQAFGC